MISIKELLEKNFSVNVESLDINILELENFDSLNFIELLDLFENEKIEITFEELTETKTLKEMEALINDRK